MTVSVSDKDAGEGSKHEAPEPRRLGALVIADTHCLFNDELTSMDSKSFSFGAFVCTWDVRLTVKRLIQPNLGPLCGGTYVSIFADMPVQTVMQIVAY